LPFLTTLDNLVQTYVDSTHLHPLCLPLLFLAGFIQAHYSPS
jgi:hypothetical protein